MQRESGKYPNDTPTIRDLAVGVIGKSGETQHRAVIDRRIVTEYAALMAEGVVFPPVRTWFDGAKYWLSDGFHRVAAAEEIGLKSIRAEIYTGTLVDAQWDSYTANSHHGRRPTREDMRHIIRMALQHPNSAAVSNVELARHLGVPEATLRRYRAQACPSPSSGGVRIVKRGASTYALNTHAIGQSRRARRLKTIHELQDDLAVMKERASPNALRFLTIVGNWAFGTVTFSDCLSAIERAISSWTSPSKNESPTAATGRSARR